MSLTAQRVSNGQITGESRLVSPSESGGPAENEVMVVFDHAGNPGRRALTTSSAWLAETGPPEPVCSSLAERFVKVAAEGKHPLSGRPRHLRCSPPHLARWACAPLA